MKDLWSCLLALVLATSFCADGTSAVLNPLLAALLAHHMENRSSQYQMIRPLHINVCKVTVCRSTLKLVPKKPICASKLCKSGFEIDQMQNLLTSCKWVEVLNCVTQTSSSMRYRYTTISHGEQLIEAARLKAGRHENNVTTSYYAMCYRH